MQTAARRFVPLLAAIFFALVATAAMAQPGLVGAPSDCQTRYFGPKGLLSAEKVGPRSLVDLVKLEPEWDPQKKGKLRWRSVSRFARLHKLGVFHGRSLYRIDYSQGNKRMLAVEHEGFIFCPILLHENGREAESIVWEHPHFLSSGAEEKILAMRTNRWALRKPEALHYFRIGEDGALRAEVPYELKHYRVWVEEQDEELRRRQGNGGMIFWIRIEDKRTGLVERGLIGGWSLTVKDMDEDPPEFYTWWHWSASEQNLCRHRILNDTCEAWCLVFQEDEENLRASQPKGRTTHRVEKCSDAERR